IALREADGDFSVGSIVPAGPAARSGNIRVGDRILAVDPANVGDLQSVAGATTAEVTRKIKGPRGSTMRLELVPAGQDKSVVVEMKREKVQSPLVRGTIFDVGDPAQEKVTKVGYLLVPSYYGPYQNAKGEDSRSSSGDARKFLSNLKADVLVLDLRGTGG